MRDEAKGEKARGKQYQMVQMRGENGGGLNRDKKWKGQEKRGNNDRRGGKKR